MREAFLVHQADGERHLAQLFDGETAVGQVLADPEDVLLAHVEVDIDRVELDDGRELGGGRGADQLADRDQMLGHDAVERSRDGRIAEVGLGNDEIALGILDIGPRRVALGLGLIEGVLRQHVLPQQGFLAGELGLGVHELRLGAVELGFALLDLGLVHRLLDLEEQVALLHQRAVDIVDRGQEALDAGHQVDRCEGDGVAGQGLERLDRLLHRVGDADFPGRRRHELVLGLAARQQQRRCQDGGRYGGNPSEEAIDCKFFRCAAAIPHGPDDAPSAVGKR